MTVLSLTGLAFKGIQNALNDSMLYIHCPYPDVQGVLTGSNTVSEAVIRQVSRTL